MWEPTKHHPLTQSSRQHCMVGALPPHFTDEETEAQRGKAPCRAVQSLLGALFVGSSPGLRLMGSPSRIPQGWSGPPSVCPPPGLARKAGLLGSDLLRLGRPQPRALGRGCGVMPKVVGLSPRGKGRAAHLALCLGALPLPAPGVLLTGSGRPQERRGRKPPGRRGRGGT